MRVHNRNTIDSQENEGNLQGAKNSVATTALAWQRVAEEYRAARAAGREGEMAPSNIKIKPRALGTVAAVALLV
jgi:hypothetical protein